jgi:selenocysteine lyase/cysteine desulfurase
VCHKHGVVVVVDAAHVPGHLQVDIQDIDADFYSGEHIFVNLQMFGVK